ncbi:cupin domain-containing protein [Streptomyces sp. NBC_01476]|uniref:JmjC domain-containing protein n=1 Tax=Streptomyces sp. NBC_01476 TaxID=2903881 RepID=UPI002E3683C2|nr:cupin domain-containing protein [Streptomyces sp. NBC_01476]
MTAKHRAVVARLGEDFLAGAFGRTFRHVPGEAGMVADIFGWDDLNEILGRHRLEVPRLRLSADGVTVPQDAYAQSIVNRRANVWQNLHPAAFHQQLADGATLVIDALEELHPPVHLLADDLQSWLRARIQVNLYASWTGKEGFGTHWDDHDVVVVQLDGSKRWKLYGPTRIAPMHQDVAEPEAPPEEPTAEFVLTAGDLLYLPRGWWHSVSASEGERSLHLTCGLTSVTGADLITWLSEILRRDEAVRADLPRFGTPEEKQQFADRLRDLLMNEFSDGADLVDRFAAHRDATERVRMRPSLPHVFGVPNDPHVLVRLLSTTHDVASDESGNVVLTAGGETWTFASAARPVLDRLADRHPHTLKELVDGTGLSVEQAAALVWELVKGQVAAVGNLS